MTLTEKGKKHIEEEEAYRTKIREEAQFRDNISSHPKKKGISGCLVAILIILAFPIFLAMTLIAINPASQIETAEENTQNSHALEIKNGVFQDFTGKEYAYSISSESGNDIYVASFEPFLINDDRILIQAILEVFITMYGENSLIDPTPLLEERNGINLIKFRGGTGYYYVNPIKEDTGEIHTLSFWKE